MRQNKRIGAANGSRKELFMEELAAGGPLPSPRGDREFLGLSRDVSAAPIRERDNSPAAPAAQTGNAMHQTHGSAGARHCLLQSFKNWPGHFAPIGGPLA